MFFQLGEQIEGLDGAQVIKVRGAQGFQGFTLDRGDGWQQGRGEQQRLLAGAV
jgi:hypothetical protein